MSYQKVILVGTVVHTPQYRQKRENVEQATRLQLMTERPTANGGTEREYHIVLIYGPLADVAHQYVHKGNQVHVEGWLRTRKYLAREQTMKEIIKRAKKLLKEPYEDQDYFQWLELTYMAALMDKYLTDLCLMGPLLHYMAALDDYQLNAISVDVMDKQAEDLLSALNDLKRDLKEMK